MQTARRHHKYHIVPIWNNAEESVWFKWFHIETIKAEHVSYLGLKRGKVGGKEGGAAQGNRGTLTMSRRARRRYLNACP